MKIYTDDDGNFEHLSFDELKRYVKFKNLRDIKMGCIVIRPHRCVKEENREGGGGGIKACRVGLSPAQEGLAIRTNTL